MHRWFVHYVESEVRSLNFFYGDGARLTNFHTAFATQALVLVHRFGLAVNDFIYIHGTYIYAFSVASAFVFVNGNFEHLFFLHWC